jgi:putative effector of murein hydrolase LrgA (UPF0299 family)
MAQGCVFPFRMMVVRRAPDPATVTIDKPASAKASVLPGLTWLLACQSAGEVLARLTHVGLPGPVLGMLILLLLLRWDAVRAPVGAVAEALLAHLSLLFVPVGVGVMTHVPLIAQYGIQLVATLVLSTWVGLLVTALVFRAMLRQSDDRAAEAGTEP